MAERNEEPAESLELVKRETEVISKVTVGGIESHRTQSGVGRVGTNSLG